MTSRFVLRLWVAFAITVSLAPRSLVAGPPSALEADVDRIFARWNASTPGCAVGVGIGGRPVLLKGYGMADLEHDVPITADTVFEAGSVSKQFTAMAVLLLAKDGKLSIDDPVRKYVPELPDYGAPLTIRHMLTHTSGLRDWGSVESIAGWPRATRVYTHAHVLDIVSRQRSLNFPTGTQWSYSNTGFNLAAIIVERVSGMRFSDFTRQRIFGPLEMNHTSWRDDHTRIVKGRAVAYAEEKDGFHTEMPFENIYGNGGLLTTVGDLLKWNENFVSPKVGTSDLIADQERPAHTNNGKELDYALGLYVSPYRGVRSVWHSGSTAGYRAHLSQYPDEHASIAVLCNVTSGEATPSNNKVADLVLAGRFTGPASERPVARPVEAISPPPSASQLSELTGDYWSEEAEVTLTARVDNGHLILFRRPDSTLVLTPTAPDTFRTTGLGTVTFHRDTAGRVTDLSVTQERVWDLRFTRK